MALSAAGLAVVVGVADADDAAVVLLALFVLLFVLLDVDGISAVLFTVGLDVELGIAAVDDDDDDGAEVVEEEEDIVFVEVPVELFESG